MPVIPSEAFRQNLSFIVLAAIGLASIGLQPVLVSSMIEHSGYAPGATGYIASAEVFGIALTNLTLTFAGARLSWRMLSAAGLVLILIGGALSLSATPVVSLMIVARFISGLGSGLLISRSYAAAGLTSNADKMLGYILAGSTAHTAAASLLLPIAAEQWGTAAIFIYFMLITLAGFPVLKGMPERADDSVTEARSGSLAAERFTALGAAGLLFLGLGVLWPYLFQIGLAMGATSEQAAIGLTLSQVAAFGGALVAGLAGRIMPAFTMSVLTVVLTAISVLLMDRMTGHISYGVLASGFNGASNASMVLLLGAVALVDTDGRWIAAAVAAQTLGFAFGPAIAGVIVADGHYGRAELLSVVLLVLSLVVATVSAVLTRSRERRDGLHGRQYQEDCIG